jgi:hypothetical protein
MVRLALPRTPAGGRLGERLGSGTGSSLEFQDYRQYALGDDLRHVDWSAYARSEVLTVRLYREEVAPRIDLVFDVSRSMVVTEQKTRGYEELCALLACASASAEADTRVVTATAEEARPLERPEQIEHFLHYDARYSVLDRYHSSFATRSVRVVISDFLFRMTPMYSSAVWPVTAPPLHSFSSRCQKRRTRLSEGGRRMLDVKGTENSISSSMKGR